MRATLICNPRAGNGVFRIGRASDLFASQGWELDRVTSSNRFDMMQAARKAVLAGVEAIVAAGGDGTVSTVASVVAGTTSVLGVLPTGTLNHFARDLGIPLDLNQAARVILRRNVGTVDIAEVNGRRFVNNSSLGLYPSIVRYRESREKTGWSRLVAFGAGLVLAFRRYRFLKLRLEVDGTVYERSSPFLFVGNNRYQIEGLRLGRRRSLSGGELSVYLSDRTGRIGLIRIAASALIKRLRLNHDFAVMPAHTVVVQSNRRRIQVALDGEVIKLHPPLCYSIRPGLLRVFTP